MIRMVAGNQDGPLIVLGITADDVQRLQDGKLVATEIGDLLLYLAAHERAQPPRDQLGLVVMHGETHRAIIDKLHQAGIELSADALEQAIAIDGENLPI